MEKLKSLLAKREIILVIVILILSFLVSCLTPFFFTSTNLLSMMMGLTVEGLVSIGMVILLITGGLDLSVGSTMAFTGVLTGLLIKASIPTPLAVLIALTASILIGSVNGVLIAKAKLNAFITTLGVMMAVKGIMLVISNGKAVLNMPTDLKMLGQGSLFGIQYPIIIMIALVVLMDLIVRNSRVMRQSYYVGCNESAAKLNGINVDRVKIVNYSLSALFAGISGVLLTARFGSASVTLGDNTAMNVITAAIIGGASLNGGQGSVLGAFLGAVFMQIVSTSLNLLNVNIYWQNFTTGAILILAILMDSLNEIRKATKKAI